MAINRSGKRRGATCAYLESWHYDIEDFLELREQHRRPAPAHPRHEHGQLDPRPVHGARSRRTGSGRCSPRTRCRDLHRPLRPRLRAGLRARRKRGRARRDAAARTVPATALWRKMLTMLFETGNGWITFKDPCNDRVAAGRTPASSTARTCAPRSARHRAPRDGGVQPRIAQPGAPRRATASSTRRRSARPCAWRCAMLDRVDRHQLLPDPRGARPRTCAPPRRPRPHGLQDALLRARPAVRRAGGDRSSPTGRGGDLVSRHPGVGGAGGRSAAPTRSYAGSKWDRGMLPYDTLALLDAERGVPVDVNRTRRLDWAPVCATRRRARHAQLEHDGHRPDRDHRQHRRLLSLHRADLQEHLRQGQHQRRVHDGQRATWSPNSRRSGCGATTCSTT